MHPWTFVRAGGFEQVRLRSGADLAALGQLDQKLWAALSCPTRGLEFDAATLDAIDTDHDGRIRAPEILAATSFALARLQRPDDLLKSAKALPLDAISTSTPEGRAVLASARQILVNLGKRDATEITVEDTTDTARIFAATALNGDGVVPAEATEDPELRAVIADIVKVAGSVADRGGNSGITAAILDRFHADATAWSAWWAEAEADPAILPLATDTAAASDALEAVRAKIEDWFARCRLAAFDARAAGPLNRAEEEYVAIASRTLSLGAPEVAGFPLAHVSQEAALPLRRGINPAWADAMALFRDRVVTRILGERDSLTEADWRAVDAAFAPFRAWRAREAGTAVAPLGLPRVRAILAGPYRRAIEALIAADEELREEFEAISEVDRLVRYYRDLYRLLNNFVTLHAFYARQDKAIFQAGTLFCDQRSCDLCIRVEDLAAHSAVAGSSGTYLAYCEIRRLVGDKLEKRTIAAAFTAGDANHLMVGRNGIFYDRQGRDWDATIVKIVDHPISIRQAFWAPYRKIARLVEDEIARFASAREKAVEATAAEKIAAGSAAAQAPTVKKPEPFDAAKFAGMFAAFALAIGSIGGAIGAVVSAFVALAWWQIPLAIAGALMVVSGPSMLIAALKLRQRNLGPLLDANGWAINARARINLTFGQSLTSMAALPAGASLDLVDPYEERGRVGGALWTAAIVAAVAGLLWWSGVLPRMLGVEQTDVPVATAPAPGAPAGAAAAPAAPAPAPPSPAPSP